MITERMRGPRWEGLLPEVKEKTLDLLALAKKEGLEVMFWEGWRSEGEQLQKMAKGVSFVKDPLNGKHLWGMAVDIVFRNAAGLPSWPDPKIPENKAKWERLGKIGESLGFEWGGRWKNYDGPHFQLSTNLKLVRMSYSRPGTFLKDKGVMV